MRVLRNRHGSTMDIFKGNQRMDEFNQEDRLLPPAWKRCYVWYAGRAHQTVWMLHTSSLPAAPEVGTGIHSST
jgi:hypothetical protein